MCVDVEAENTENSFNDENELGDTDGEEMAKYYQRYNPQINRWVKIDSDTGLIVAVKKSPGAYKNLPKNPPRYKKIKKGFFDFF